MKNLTQAQVKEAIYYEPTSGIFTWQKSMSTRARKGDVAGNLEPAGYIRITIYGVRCLAHRLAVFYMEGYWPEHTVDHINRVRSDNRYVNLREATMQCQRRNCTARRGTISKITGVYQHSKTKRWYACIAVDQMVKYLGTFATRVEAAYARFAAEQCLGFQDCDVASSAKKFIDASL
jgi:hypothetical protein